MSLKFSILAALVSAPLAFAQEPPQPRPPPPPRDPGPPPPAPEYMPDRSQATPDDSRISPFFVTGIGVSVEGGGGFGSFLDRSATGISTASGNWMLRTVVGTRRHWAFDGGYVGNAQTVNTLGVEHNAKLSGNGLEASARFNLLTGMWQPYASAGLGLMYYSFGDANITTSDISGDGAVLDLPLAAGLAVRMYGLVLDARVAVKPATSSRVLAGANLSSWDVGARAGFEF